MLPRASTTEINNLRKQIFPYITSSYFLHAVMNIITSSPCTAIIKVEMTFPLKRSYNSVGKN